LLEVKAAARARTPIVGPVLVDSGPLIALFNGRDAWHAPVVGWLQANTQVRLVTTWPVAAEVCALLARRVANAAALDFLRWSLRGGVEVDAPAGTALADMLTISERFQDLPFDVADASVAEAAARLRIRQVCAARPARRRQRMFGQLTAVASVKL
jgi:uncharacterized protein